MSFDARETSTELAQPIELYRFVREDKCWLYTSGDEDVTFQGELYRARTISRSAFSRNDESGSSEVEVRMDRELSILSQFLDASSPNPVSIWIYRMHRNDPEFAIIFKGVVANAGVELEEVALTCKTPLSKEDKLIPREIILRTCPHVLYGNRCRVDPTAYDVATTISSIGSQANQYNLASDGGNPDGWFAAGVLLVVGTGQRGFIQRHQGNQVEVLQAIPGLGPSDSVIVYAGCDRTVETCRDKFNNVAQFGGFPKHPERNPFVQISVD